MKKKKLCICSIACLAIVLCILSVICIKHSNVNKDVGNKHVEMQIQEKKDISQASIKDLENVDGIGIKLATRIHDYVAKNNIKSIDQIKQGNISRVGVKTLTKLKEKYK